MKTQIISENNICAFFIWSSQTWFREPKRENSATRSERFQLASVPEEANKQFHHSVLKPVVHEGEILEHSQESDQEPTSTAGLANLDTFCQLSQNITLESKKGLQKNILKTKIILM